jgi:PRC-barrel domain
VFRGIGSARASDYDGIEKMLHHTKSLKGFTIRAMDGEIGKVEEFYFDDEAWTIRYLIVETGTWLGGRLVLISPISVVDSNWDDRFLDVGLTKAQVANGPDIDTHKPVSRQHEAEYLGYYGYAPYWGGLSLWGPGFYPSGLLLPPVLPDENPATASSNATMISTTPAADAHLRSSAEVGGYRVEAADGEIGHVAGFLVEGETWGIRYIEVATRNWWPGKKVLVSPAWIERVSWADASIYAALSRQTIQSAPEYTESMGVNREYEADLYRHYGQATYWARAMASHVPGDGYGNT